MSPSPLHCAFLLTLAFAASASLALAQATAPGDTSPEPAPSASPTPAESSSPGKRSFTDAIPCSACHTTTAWRANDAAGEEAKFDHSTTGFPLTGEHIHAPCVACHNATRAIKRACVSCHDDFHRGRLSQSCDTCHSPSGWKSTRPLDIHRMTRFPLTGMHVLAACSECHQRASEHRWTDAPVDCFACHEKDYRRPGIQPVHVGTATSPPFPRDCSLCHRAMAWVPAAAVGSVSGPLSSFGSPLRAAPPSHDLRFPIGFGVHRSATCDDCHVSPNVPRAVRCIGCHVHDVVRLAAQHRQPIPTDGAACLTCHPGGAHR
jgi:hypothetical protein